MTVHEPADNTCYDTCYETCDVAKLLQVKDRCQQGDEVSSMLHIPSTTALLLFTPAAPLTAFACAAGNQEASMLCCKMTAIASVPLPEECTSARHS